MKAQTMRRVRQYHFYLGLFFAPAILLFSLSGAFQTFRLQEAEGYGGTPPRWVVWMASVHKDQSLPREKHDALHVTKPTALAVQSPSSEQDQPLTRISPLPLKIFVVLMSLGLLAAAILGIVIALTNRMMRQRSMIILVSGAALPLLLLLI